MTSHCRYMSKEFEKCCNKSGSITCTGWNFRPVIVEGPIWTLKSLTIRNTGDRKPWIHTHMLPRSVFMDICMVSHRKYEKSVRCSSVEPLERAHVPWQLGTIDREDWDSKELTRPGESYERKAFCFLAKCVRCISKRIYVLRVCYVCIVAVTPRRACRKGTAKGLKEKGRKGTWRGEPTN